MNQSAASCRVSNINAPPLMGGDKGEGEQTFYHPHLTSPFPAITAAGSSTRGRNYAVTLEQATGNYQVITPTLPSPLKGEGLGGGEKWDFLHYQVKKGVQV